MSRENAMIATFDEVSVFQKPTLFTSLTCEPIQPYCCRRQGFEKARAQQESKGRPAVRKKKTDPKR